MRFAQSLAQASIRADICIHTEQFALQDILFVENSFMYYVYIVA